MAGDTGACSGRTRRRAPDKVVGAYAACDSGPMGQAVGSTEVIALFPLGTVLLPGLVLPLHVFEPRYRALVADLLARDPADRYFGVVAIRHGAEVGPVGDQQLHEVGTVAVVHELEPQPDGRVHLVTVGGRRFRIRALVPAEADGTPPYQRAAVEWLPEDVGDDAAVLAPAVVRALAEYRTALGATGPDELPGDPTVLSYAVAAATVLDPREVQGLLALPDTTARLRAELALLRRETGLLGSLRTLPTFDLPRTTEPN